MTSARSVGGRLVRGLLRRMGLALDRVDEGTVVATRLSDARTSPRVLRLRRGLSVLSDEHHGPRVRKKAVGKDVWLLGAGVGRLRSEQLARRTWVVGGGKPLRSRRLGRRLWLVGGEVAARPVRSGLWLVGSEEPAVDGLQLMDAGSGSFLVSPAGTSAMEREQGTSKALGDRHVAWLLEQYAVDCVIDVGANNGQFARSLRRAGYTGHIVSIEPVPRFAEASERASSDDERWTVHQMALGQVDGELPLWVQHSFTSTLTASDFGRDRFPTLHDLHESEQIRVPLRRLDSAWDDLLATVHAAGIADPRVYLKMDTQGLDLEVFQGLGERVRSVVAMQSEVALVSIYEDAPRLPEALALYEAAGFEVTGFFPVNQDDDGRIIEYDCTLVRAETFPGKRHRLGA